MRRNGRGMTPQISVVIPAHQAGRTLPDTLRSLARQRFGDFEAIIVDDGSTDDTAKRAIAAAERDPRLRLVRQANAGAAAARNAGLFLSGAPYVLFLDADDTLRPQALDRLHATAQTTGAEAVVARAVRVDGTGRRWPFPEWDLSEPFERLARECALAIHAALFRREPLIALGGFDPSLVCAEDWDLWQRLARTGARFVQLRDVVAEYHSRPGSLSKRVVRMLDDTLLVMARGRGPDPRVARPHPAFANGVPPDDLAAHRLNFLLWSGARMIAAGGDPAPALARLGGEAGEVDPDPDRLAAMLVDGMADMLCVQPSALAPRWPQYGLRLRALLEGAFPGAERARLREAALLHAQHRIGRSWLENPLKSDAVRAVEVDLAAPAATRRGAGDALAVRVSVRGRPVSLALCCPHGGDDPMALARDALGRAGLGAAARVAWRAPAFWPAAVLTARAALAHPPPRAALTHPRRLRGWLETRARHALRRGVARLAGPAPAPAARRPSGGVGRTPILMFHNVCEGGDPRFSLSPAAFAARLALLRRAGYESLSLADWAAAMAAGAPPPDRRVILTFDDGAADFLDQAWPLLRAHGFGAALFPVVELADVAAPGRLGWPAIAQLAAAGVEIGGHGASHRRLTRLSLAAVRAEAETCRRAIAQHCGAPPLAFAYPHGALDDGVASAVASAGFALGLTCAPEPAAVHHAPMRLPRVEVRGDEDLARFARRVGL